MDAKVNILLSGIIADIDRRCHEITHPIADNDEVIRQMNVINEIAFRVSAALSMVDRQVERLEDVAEFIKKVKEHEQDKKTD